MDYSNHTLNNNGIISNKNLGMENNNNESKLNIQLEVLKDQLKTRELEISEMMKIQKEEYEKYIQQRDQEVSNLVDQLVSENQELKKQILNIEIEKEFYKETLNEFKKSNDFIFFDEENNLNNSQAFINNNLNLNLNVTNTIGKNNQNNNPNNLNPTDKLFFQAIKHLKEINENKVREVNEKYDLFYYNFLKEKNEQISKIQNFDLENYFEQNSHLNRNELEESLIPVDFLDEQFLILENKVKIFFEELKNKETQILLIENKFDLLNEENRAIKRKFNEEKKFLLVKILEIKSEHEKVHKQIIKKFEEEIREKKINLQKKVEESLKINEEIIQNLIKEKNQLLDNLREAEKKCWVLNQELESSEKERRLIEEFYNKTQNDIELKKNELICLEENNKKIKLENESLIKTKDDLLHELNEINFRNNSIESENKILIAKLNLKTKEIVIQSKDNENVYKNLSERLNQQIIETERKMIELNLEKEKNIDKVKILEKKILNETEIIKQAAEENEILKLNLNQIKLYNKNLMIEIEEKTKHFERYKINQIQDDAEILKKDQIIKNLKDSVAILEKENIFNSTEIEKLNKIKKDLFIENEELIKSKSNIINQIDTLKVSYNLELQKLKIEIAETEKKNQEKSEINIEIANNSLKKEINDIRKGLYTLYYKYVLNKEGIHHLPHPLPKLDENKILEELDTLLDKNHENLTDKLLDNLTYNSRSNSAININNSNSPGKPSDLNKIDLLSNKDLKSEINRLNLENSKLKTKIKELNSQLQELKLKLSSSNSIANLKVLSNENKYFKAGEKEVKYSLYESLIIYLKNINLHHIMEVYQLNIQREEDIKKILESKNIPGIESFKIQFSKLSENLNNLKNACENAMRDYHLRSKSYISFEEFENKILEHKNFTENILNMILSKFFEKKDARNDIILFKFSHNEYNQIIEDLTGNLENFHKKEFNILENLKKNLLVIEPAIDILVKQTVLDSDKLNNIFNDSISKLI